MVLWYYHCDNNRYSRVPSNYIVKFPNHLCEYYFLHILKKTLNSIKNTYFQPEILSVLNIFLMLDAITNIKKQFFPIPYRVNINGFWVYSK